jgi:hydroxyacid-oxoacid transhydrogenase
VEPKDSGIKGAIDFAKPWKPDAFLAVGGGSVIDTAKLMNLYTTFPSTTLVSVTSRQTCQQTSKVDFLDFVNAPLDKDQPVPSSSRLSPYLQQQEQALRQLLPPSSI